MNPAGLFLACLAPTTRRVAEGDLRTIAGYALPYAQGDVANLDWHLVTPADAARARGALADRYAPTTANRMLANLRGVVKACWQHGALTFERHLRVLAALPPVRGSRLTKGRSLTFDQLGLVLDAAGGYEERALVALAAGAGLRRAELAGLTWDRCSPTGDGTWYVRVLGKGNKERRLRVPAWAGSALSKWRARCDAREHVFQWRDGRAIFAVVAAASKRAGVGPVAPHDLRRTFAGLALSTGVGVADLRRMMGHASIATTVKYDRRADDTVLEESSRLDGLTRRNKNGSPGGESDGSSS